MTQPKELTLKEYGFAFASFLLGVWAFIKVNTISGPAFEPIIAACTNPDIDISEFEEKTGYHIYEPKVGLGAFNILVCLITQFLLELRETYPEGILVWGGVILVSYPAGVLTTLEAGRAEAKGPIRYPVILGCLYQLIGVSVVFPMVWVPSYILGRGYGPLSMMRINFANYQMIPGGILTLIIFLASTDSYLWTVSAGILGGPLIAMQSLGLSMEKPVPVSKEAIDMNTSVRPYGLLLMALSFGGWCILVAIAYQSYGTSFGNLWTAIWVDANASVAFMTVDTIVFYIGLLLAIAYQNMKLAMKLICLTPILGPGCAGCLVLNELERKTYSEGKIESKEE